MKIRIVPWLALAAALLPCRAEAQLLDGIAAVVGTNIITFAEVGQMVRPVERELRLTYSGPELQSKLKAAALDALNRLVERQLIIQEFNSKEFRIPDAAVEEQLRDTIRRDYGGDKQLMIKTITAQGYTMARYREDIRNRIIIQAMTQKEIAGEIIISPAKIEKYYAEHKEDFRAPDRVKLRLLMVKKYKEGDNTVPRKLIEEIHARLKEGANFAELAQKHSEGSNNKEQQGDWGWIERDTLRKELSEVAFTLQAGQFSEVIETDDGFYILKVEDVKPSHIRPLSEVRDEIERKLVTAERQRLQQAWIDRLKAKAYIRYH